MKKIILTLALALTAISASAQLNVKSKSESPTNIASAVQSRAILFHSSKIGYILAIGSDNRYDKPGKFLLGEDEDGAIKTLQGLRASGVYILWHFRPLMAAGRGCA